MALESDSWGVPNGRSSARLARLMLQSATRSGNGVIEAGDMRVSPLTVPGGAVQIGSGGAVALGKEATFQGSYYAYNVGTETVEISPTGSGSGRTDLVIMRVEDPSIDGTPWDHDIADGDAPYYFRVLEGVSTMPAGTTGVPLARVTLPANTATVQAAHITDVRTTANPRNQRTLRVQRGGTQNPGTPSDWDEAGNITDDFERWPQHDWTVTIPEWATQVQVLAEWSNAFYDPRGGSGGTNDARGLLRVGLIGSQSIFTTEAAYNFNPTSGTNGYRCSAANRDQIAIPAALRGATVDVRMYARGTAGQDGRLVADNYANFSVDLEFLEIPAPEAEL